ncbi:PaaI family thioesterase [Ekhidna sp.]|uniref:PaaI family thioesterase n=1 Tax=Ekhidna sp. TaxID=2608089 RepID=UPI003B597945
MSEAHYRKLERMYLSANINTQIFDTTTCKISDGEAEIGLTVVPKYFHALNAMHGSIYFKLLDDAAFFAVNSVVEDVFVLTKSFEIHFKRPVIEGKILAKGELIASAGDSYVAKSELLNEAGKVVGYGQGEFVKSKVALSAEIGYV